MNGNINRVLLLISRKIMNLNQQLKKDILVEKRKKVKHMIRIGLYLYMQFEKIA